MNKEERKFIIIGVSDHGKISALLAQMEFIKKHPDAIIVISNDMNEQEIQERLASSHVKTMIAGLDELAKKELKETTFKIERLREDMVVPVLKEQILNHVERTPWPSPHFSKNNKGQFKRKDFQHRKRY